ncbi:MAG: GNAT family N-acetyltransferase [Planctomycetes bacterium]|nr:GNAT family N-acetyltransferase [Planctomycetota bacterium]
MANAKIDVVGPGDLTLIADLYSQIFKPARDVEFFKRRFLGRYSGLLLVASVEGRPAGFASGFELKPGVFFSWLVGVLPDYRRQGIGSQLFEALEQWARDHEYEGVRFECHNQHRPMLHLGIAQKYDIVGIRWDSDRHANLVIFEKALVEHGE